MGKLVVVGTGIVAGRHLTVDAKWHIENADRVLYLVADIVTDLWIQRAAKSAESLQSFYEEGRPRSETYRLIIEHTLELVRSGLDVCVVSYGHPGVFAYPMHESVRRARAEGFKAVMLPSISAEDCLFAELGVDPATHGCQSFEATDFLVHRRVFDPTSSLILWQIAVTGELGYAPARAGAGVPVLVEVLQQTYGPDHEVVIYEASPLPMADSRVDRMPLRAVVDTEITPASTLYVPPLRKPQRDDAMVDRLGMNAGDFISAGEAAAATAEASRKR